MKVLISTSSFGAHDPQPLGLLEEAGVEAKLARLGRSLKADEIETWANGCDGIIAGTEPLEGSILRRLTDLKAISRVGVGLDNVDLKTADELGIVVFNTPDGPTEAVAELTVALILDLLRGVSRADTALRQGRWEKKMGRLLKGKTVGIVGLGRIGKRVAQLLQVFGCSLIACDICPDTEWAEINRVGLIDKELLLQEADIVTLHAACVSDSRPLIGEEELALMKPSSILINAARGGLVDEKALVATLDACQIGGAALDTFDTEPYNGSLCGLQNVVLTPHIGSYAREARAQMELLAVENILSGLGLKEGQA